MFSSDFVNSGFGNNRPKVAVKDCQILRKTFYLGDKLYNMIENITLVGPIGIILPEGRQRRRLLWKNKKYLKTCG
ncbi:hypothetical protein KsCSTR_14200 [Candidatus Kuenenia stuttgartiensis]|uniref:Uncharacterized protein n=1 Tax=Kuenenia stuttgartiensis TaxID=174633 RepID=Q1Q195_KUEST|nr:hypothetical protein KsCSTR_14200 [Candidatus Kuenenia stuttgartiensis]TVM01084.1 MAG: hypothetical protein CV080_05985 [Candidatus Kuenenia stuttgartiensis]CAJ73771.1 unknown protein [Candidatus Kuenenia stuttgartiensis]